MISGFKPIISKEPRVLILGSMPSVKSLEKQEYYGFKQNRFWKIMASYFNVHFTDYQDKVNCILEHHLVLWDVINSCEREGSLDSAIKQETINDIEGLLQAYPSIVSIICNGRKSYDLYKKHFKHIDIECVYLPSTSGANQTIKQQDLYNTWFVTMDKYNLKV